MTVLQAAPGEAVVDRRFGPLPAHVEAALKELQALPPAEALDLWSTLAPPDFASFSGEYAGCFPTGLSPYVQTFVDGTIYGGPYGHWLGKCYRPLGRVSGEGYNAWLQPDGEVTRSHRFGTHLGTSRIDGRLSLLMTYSSYNRTPSADAPANYQVDLIDELRQYREGLIIGVGTQSLLSVSLGPDASEVIEHQREHGLEISQPIRLGDRTHAVMGVFFLAGPVQPYRELDADLEDS